MTQAASHALTAALSGRLEPGSVDPSAIERELRRLNEDASPEARTVRACMSNLIVYCDHEEHADRVPPGLGDLVEEHPARILLLEGGSAALASGIAAEVAALCYLGSGGRQICSDHVRIRAAPGAERRLPAAVRPLLIGDLPTALWWATPEPATGSEVFRELAPMAEQVIYDSARWSDPVRAVAAIADWSGGTRRRVTDLAWPRLRPWRRVIAEVFDPRRLPGGIDAIRELELEHGPQALPQAWLMIGWLARCLGWQLRGGRKRAADVVWSFESKTGPVTATVRERPEGAAQILGVSIQARAPGVEAVARIAAPDAERLALQIEGTVPSQTVIPLRPLSLASLLATQLSERGPDPLFRDALAMSRQLARAVLS